MHFENLSHGYRNVQIALTAFGYALLAAAALFLLLLDDARWCIATECAIAIAFAVNMVIIPKAWLFKGYALRENDISYRSGIIFPTVTTIPFNRLQQVSVKQNPVSKYFNLYSVEIVNGAQAYNAMTIPGLSEEKALQIKNLVISKQEHGKE